IWKPVSIQAWDRARVDDVQIIVNKISSDTAVLTANVAVEASETGAATIVLENVTDNTVAGKQQVTLNQGANKVSFDFTVSRPKLWWPNGLGAQPIYSFRARSLADGKVTDEKLTRTGLRSLELRQQRDEAGQSFMFVINGVPVFAKGGNWIPADR